MPEDTPATAGDAMPAAPTTAEDESPAAPALDARGTDVAAARPDAPATPGKIYRVWLSEIDGDRDAAAEAEWRSEEHTSELPSLMRTSYAVICLNKKKTT